MNGCKIVWELTRIFCALVLSYLGIASFSTYQKTYALHKVETGGKLLNTEINIAYINITYYIFCYSVQYFHLGC